MPDSGPLGASGGQQDSALTRGGLAPDTISQPARGTGPPPCTATGADSPCSPRRTAGNLGMTAEGGHTASGRSAGVAGGPPTSHPPSAVPAAAGWGDQAVLAIYRRHYGSLVRQAARLVWDIPTAEDVVQDSIIAMHTTCPRLEDDAKALPYLRQAVANRSRSVLRHRAVAGQHRPLPGPDMPSAEDSALARLDHSAVISALTTLARRQRQVLALRYFADMSEAQIAAALGISKSAVKTHAARALTSLRPVLGSRA
jgi:RNA polymerase sigma-70 factor (sigma-E family)